MQTQIDSLSIADLESRYQVNRANIYARISKLKKKGYQIELENYQGKVRANADQIVLLDAYHKHLKSGEKTNTFPNFGEEMSSSLARQSRLSRETEDSNLVKLPTRSPSSSQLVSTQQIIDIAQVLAAIVPAPPASPPPDPLENLRRIEEAHCNKWRLSTSQLAPLLGLKSLTGKEFSRFGYVFTRSGRNGAESAWKIDREK